MSEAELVFKDGSTMKGSYRIFQLGVGLKQLTFTSRESPINAFKETDLLRLTNGRVIASGLVSINVNNRNGVTTITCEFIDKT